MLQLHLKLATDDGETSEIIELSREELDSLIEYIQTK